MSAAPFVGLIVNPASGRDIRRLVAQAWIVTHQEKIAITARLLEGLRAAGVRQLRYMPEPRGICAEAAARIGSGGLELAPLAMPVTGRAEDSTLAARLLALAGAACIVVLGGDGTSRATFKGCGPAMPLLPISTGTNNVFPEFQEGTTAGHAAGLLALGRVRPEAACRRCKLLRLRQDGHPDDLALVDLAVLGGSFIAARALWDVSRLRALFLTRGEPWHTGLSAIGGCVHPTPADAPHGLQLTFAPGGRRVLAPIAPGRYGEVEVQSVQTLPLGQPVAYTVPEAATLALDGERDLIARAGDVLRIELSPQGPLVLNVPAALTMGVHSAV